MRADDTVGRAWRYWRDRFAEAKLPTPSLDARVLAQHVLGVQGVQLALREHEPIDGITRETLAVAARRRLDGEPVARIVGGKEFFGRDFALNSATLVPRPETELLVEKCVQALRGTGQARFLELGVGSGCVAISILAEMKAVEGVATDVAVEALEMSATNATAHGVRARLDLRHGGWFAPIGREERFDLIVSNPPYIASHVIEGLTPDVRVHDPRAALDGGADGLSAYRAIAASASFHLRAGGRVAVEIGFDQADPVSALFVASGLELKERASDLSGHDRVLVIGQKG